MFGIMIELDLDLILKALITECMKRLKNVYLLLNCKKILFHFFKMLNQN